MVVETYLKIPVKVVEGTYQNIKITTLEDLKLAESKEEIVLDLKKFNKLEKVIKSRLVLYTIMSIFGTTKGIEKVHVDDIIKLCDNNIGNKYLTPNKNIKVLVKDHKIYFLDQR